MDTYTASTATRNRDYLHLIGLVGPVERSRLLQINSHEYIEVLPPGSCITHHHERKFTSREEKNKGPGAHHSQLKINWQGLVQSETAHGVNGGTCDPHSSRK